jgi:hypothetical protein
MSLVTPPNSNGWTIPLRKEKRVNFEDFHLKLIAVVHGWLTDGVERVKMYLTADGIISKALETGK